MSCYCPWRSLWHHIPNIKNNYTPWKRRPYLARIHLLEWMATVLVSRTFKGMMYRIGSIFVCPVLDRNIPSILQRTVCNSLDVDSSVSSIHRAWAGCLAWFIFTFFRLYLNLSVSQIEEHVKFVFSTDWFLYSPVFLSLVCWNSIYIAPLALKLLLLLTFWILQVKWK